MKVFFSDSFLSEEHGLVSVPRNGLDFCVWGGRRGNEPIFAFPEWLWMKKAMSPHSSTLVWKIPWMEEPGRLQPMASQRVGHD